MLLQHTPCQTELRRLIYTESTHPCRSQHAVLPGGLPAVWSKAFMAVSAPTNAASVRRHANRHAPKVHWCCFLALTTADHLPAAAFAASCTEVSTSVACAASAAATSPHQPWIKLHSMPLVTLLASNASSSACMHSAHPHIQVCQGCAATGPALGNGGRVLVLAACTEH